MLEKKSDAGGYTTAYYYDRGGRLIAEVSPQNYQEGQSLSSLNRVEYTYDSMNRLKQTRNIYRDPENGQWRTVITKTYEYDANGNITKETDALGNATTYSYNLANQLIQVLDPVSQERGLSFSTKYEYDTMGRKIAETNGNGVVTGYTYDNVGNLLQKTIAGNVVETNTYDYLGNLLSRTDGNGNTTVYSYNALGKVRQVEEPGDESIASLTTTYQYDVKGNLAQKENSLGRVELYTYDNQNRVLTKAVRKNDGTETITKTYRYDVNGNRCVETDGNGNVTQNTYDVLNRLVATAKNGQTTSYTYDANGNLLTETDWLGNTNTNVYDPINRLIERHNPYCRIEKLKYNDNNAQVESMDALGQVTRFEYDQNNRLIETIDPAGYSTSQTYDNAGNIATKTDGNGNTTSYTYDWGNRPLTVTNAQNETTAYTYDLNGNMTSQQDGKGNVTTYMYNARNLLKAKIDPQGAGNPARTETYTYYADGNRQTMVDRNGKTTAYYYDIHGRLIRKVGGQNTANAETISYTYDNNGNQLTVSDRTGTTVREYDGFDRVISKTVPGIGTTTYQYDVTAGLENGFVAEIAIDPKGNRTQKTYDKAGRLKYVTADGQSTVYNYYDNGNRQSVIYPDGTREEYQYYSNNKLYQLKNTAANGTVLDIYTYTYDAAGNQTSKHEIINGVEKGTTTYAYDALNRLEQVTEPNGRVTTYTYDAAGNRAKETITANGQTVENTYTHNEQNRLTGIVTRTNGAVTETTTYTYDNNGNQLTVTKNGVLCTENTYDVFNQLIETESNGTTVTNTYNGEGLRVAKEVDGEKTQYLYEYDKIVLEVDERGNATARNVYGLNLLKRTVDGESYYYLYNGHADVTALVDATTGNIATTYYYDAFGNILEQTGNVNNFITYAGYQYDEETGLYYLNARMYDPKIGRFLQEDTYWGDATDPLSLNLYTYCANNPLVYFDPTGHFWEEAWDITKGVGQGLWNTGKGLVTGVVDTAKQTYNFYSNDPIGQFKEFGRAVAWTFESKENRTAMWNTTRKEAQNIKDAAVAYGKAKYEEFQKADLQGKARIITGIGAETVLVAVPVAKLSKLGNISKAEKALNAANQLDNIADATKSLTAIERIKNTTNILATKTKEAFQYTKTILANENGYVRLGNFGKQGISEADTIRSRVLSNITESKTARATSNYSEFAKSIEGAGNLNPNSIRFSQSSVNDAGDIIDSMKANGWQGAPIDVVRMPDGSLTSIDNTRVLAARYAGIDVKANVHDFNSSLPSNLVERFTTRNGVAPQTWGNAIMNRIGGQNSIYRNTYPYGSNLTGWGGK